jgi:hypothetical protein
MNCSRCRSCGYIYPVDELIEGECFNCAPPEVKEPEAGPASGFTFETLGGLSKWTEQPKAMLRKVVIEKEIERIEADDLGPLFG